MSFEERLKSLNIILPSAPNPVGAYVAYKVINKFIYISGQLPIDKGVLIKGKIGRDISIEKGKEAAKMCCVNILSQLKTACEGNLDNVKNCIKITGFVNSTDDFIEQPSIINPASELLTNIFGQNGKHTRSAVSVNSLPLGACVEIDAIFEIN